MAELANMTDDEVKAEILRRRDIAIECISYLGIRDEIAIAKAKDECKAACNELNARNSKKKQDIGKFTDAELEKKTISEEQIFLQSIAPIADGKEHGFVIQEKYKYICGLRKEILLRQIKKEYMKNKIDSIMIGMTPEILATVINECGKKNILLKE